MRRVILLVIVFLFVCNAFAMTQDDLLDMYSPDMDWFSAEEAMFAELPEGLSDREAEIYRMGYAQGHFWALHPAYIEGKYVINTKTGKFHLTSCFETLLIDSLNREHSFKSRTELLNAGYKACKKCNP